MTRQCAHCPKPIPPELRPSTRFCSTKCRNQVAQQRWRTKNLDRARAKERARERTRANRDYHKLYTIVCSGCGTSYETRHQAQKFCTQLCGRHHRNQPPSTTPPVLRHPRPPRVDGTLPPDEIVIEDRRNLFDYRCLMCDRRQQDSVLLTKERARLIAVSGLLPRCFACNGMVYLDEVDLRGTGSALYGHNDRYAALQRTWKVA